MTDTIYYLTGRGGQLNTGVGSGLLDRGFTLRGREMSGKFDTLSIQNQIDLISQDLQDGFWQKESKVIAVSYGAYLLLQALSDHEPYHGSILLLSPVLGGVSSRESMRYFSPPRSDKLQRLIDEEAFPKPKILKFMLVIMIGKVHTKGQRNLHYQWEVSVLLYQILNISWVRLMFHQF